MSGFDLDRVVYFTANRDGHYFASSCNPYVGAPEAMEVTMTKEFYDHFVNNCPPMPRPKSIENEIANIKDAINRLAVMCGVSFYDYDEENGCSTRRSWIE